MEQFLSGQIKKIIELITGGQEDTESIAARWVNIIANTIFVIVLFCLLVKASLLARNYIFEEWIGTNGIAKGIVEGALKTSIFFVLVICLFLLLIRVLLELKKYLHLFQVVLLLGIIRLVSELIKVLDSNNVKDLKDFAFKVMFG